MSPSADVAVRGTALTKTYGEGPDAFQALRGVDLTVRHGEFVMISGPSGSGKTTLLSILGCVLSASSGSLELLGEKVTGLPESALPELRLAYIGFIFQGHNLIASLTARENVALMFQLRGYGRGEALAESDVLLHRVGLADKGQHKPGDLSGGQRQRVAVARAIAGRPPLVLADEPTASLDAKNGQLVTELLKGLSREDDTTVLVVTHDNRIFHLADRIVHIEDGLLRKDP